MACPYQFYVRHVLRLAELDDVQELIEKNDYGIVLHAALARFHREHALVSALEPGHARTELDRVSEAVFEQAVARNALARAWLARWRMLIPEYLDWQRRREAEGWRFHAAEEPAAVTVTSPGGRALVLRGRLDRVDRHVDGRIALVDYKTQRREALQAKARVDGEDVQLPFYALLWPEPAARAEYVGIDSSVAGYPLDAEPAAIAEAVRERVGLLYDAMHDGVPLPAHGVQAVCGYCEASGLCRRKHWP
jgi:ATP-dependent helicase/nuclease subunit B